MIALCVIVCLLPLISITAERIQMKLLNIDFCQHKQSNLKTILTLLGI